MDTRPEQIRLIADDTKRRQNLRVILTKHVMLKLNWNTPVDQQVADVAIKRSDVSLGGQSPAEGPTEYRYFEEMFARHGDVLRRVK